MPTPVIITLHFPNQTCKTKLAPGIFGATFLTNQRLEDHPLEYASKSHLFNDLICLMGRHSLSFFTP